MSYLFSHTFVKKGLSFIVLHVVFLVSITNCVNREHMWTPYLHPLPPEQLLDPLQGSHFSGLTKFHDISMFLKVNFQVFFHYF